VLDCSRNVVWVYGLGTCFNAHSSLIMNVHNETSMRLRSGSTDLISHTIEHEYCYDVP
jgi:hypothetical protein